MKETELKPCPFCGSTEEPFIMPHAGGRRWSLDHYCSRDKNDEITIVISIYGNSREEVIARWNRRADNERRV